MTTGMSAGTLARSLARKSRPMSATPHTPGTGLFSGMNQSRRCAGVSLAAVQKSGVRMAFMPTKWMPLWSNDQVSAPKADFQAAPMSRYQSCSPGIDLIGAFSLLRMRLPLAIWSASPWWDTSPVISTKSGCVDIALTWDTASSSWRSKT